MTLPIARDIAGGTVLWVHVQPKASRTECAGILGDALRIRVAAPPVDGVANEAVIRFVAARCGVPRTAVVIQSGAQGRRKRLRIEGLAASSVLARLMGDVGATR